MLGGEAGKGGGQQTISWHRGSFGQGKNHPEEKTPVARETIWEGKKKTYQRGTIRGKKGGEWWEKKGIEKLVHPGPKKAKSVKKRKKERCQKE